MTSSLSIYKMGDGSNNIPARPTGQSIRSICTSDRGDDLAARAFPRVRPFERSRVTPMPASISLLMMARETFMSRCSPRVTCRSS